MTKLFYQAEEPASTGCHLKAASGLEQSYAGKRGHHGSHLCPQRILGPPQMLESGLDPSFRLSLGPKKEISWNQVTKLSVTVALMSNEDQGLAILNNKFSWMVFGEESKSIWGMSEREGLLGLPVYLLGTLAFPALG